MSDFYCDEVLSGKIAVAVVQDTEQIFAFHHTRPSYPVHIVVIPKRHIPSLIDLRDADEGLALDMLAVVRTVAAHVMQQHGACRVLPT